MLQISLYIESIFDSKIAPKRTYVAIGRMYWGGVGSKAFCSLPSLIPAVCVSTFHNTLFCRVGEAHRVSILHGTLWHTIYVSLYAFLAFWGHFWFWMGTVEVARWIRLEILNPKHMRESKIGLLEQISAVARCLSKVKVFRFLVVIWWFYGRR